MSEIIKARDIIGTILREGVMDYTSRRRLHRALALMYRETPVRRAKARRVVIDARKRRAVHRLAENTDMTEHDIAQAVGLRNGGRVSDVLNGRR